MKIAFVGKGGSGKSTLSALYTTYMLQRRHAVVLIDADTNMHSGQYFGVTYDMSKALSTSPNTSDIKHALIGNNTRIQSPAHMVKSTPPGTGSTIITRATDQVLTPYDQSSHEALTLLAVGGYSSDQAGTACYHTSLAIVENLLSHMDLKDGNTCVVDMVASTDAFSNTFHVQFDLIVLIVEPTRESVQLVNHYVELAKETGVDSKLLLIGNKIEGDDDLAYIQEQIGQPLASALAYDRTLKQYMRSADSIDGYATSHMDMLQDLFAPIATQKPLPRRAQLQELAALHTKYAQQSYITNELGDLSGQIDDEFISHA